MKKVAALIITSVITAVLGGISAKAAGPIGLGVSPSQNGCCASRNPHVQIWTSEYLDFASVTASKDPHIFGQNIGCPEYHSYGINTNGIVHDLYWDSEYPFAPGELVSVTVSPDLKGEGGDLIERGYYWSFHIGVTKGSALFDSSKVLDSPQPSNCIEAADVNSDGYMDIIMNNGNISGLTILYGSDDGTYNSVELGGSGSTPTYVCMSDLNNDYKNDLAVSYFYSSDIQLFINNGDGTFSARDMDGLNSPAPGFEPCDLNLDGKLELAVAANYNNLLQIFNNDGAANFTLDTSYQVDYPSYVKAGDFNNDFYPDLAVTTLTWPPDTISSLHIFLNDGTGHFPTKQSYNVGLGATCIVSADLNGDGYIDLATQCHYDSSISILMNNGDGSFAPRVEYQVGPGPWEVVAGDFDADSDFDLAVPAYYDSTISIFKNNGDGTFAPRATYHLTYSPVGICAADFNGDGTIDLAAAHDQAPVITILYNEDVPLSVGDDNRVPSQWGLAQNYPNPFNAGTTIEYSAAIRSHVNISIFNTIGERVRTLVDRVVPVGEHKFHWDGTDQYGRSLASGIYFYRVTDGINTGSKKMVLLK